MNDKSLNRFRKVAIWEGISFILLVFVAMPIKYGLGMPQFVRVIGMAHGILFIAYVILLIQVAMEYDWSGKKSALGFIASLLPFGTFIFDRKLAREITEAELVDATMGE